MKKSFKPLLILFAGLAIAAGGCTPAYTGLTGNTMYSDSLADMAITPINGLQPVAHGSYIGNMVSDDNVDPTVKVRYAIYGDMKGQKVQRYAHIIFSEIADKKRYSLMAETFPGPSDLNLRTVKIDRRNWVEHTLYANRQGDWFTEFWDMNGYVTPEVWLGKRWSRSYDSSSRIVVEYREPLPECATVNQPGVVVILNNVTIDMPTPECRREVEAVLERADQAFSMRRPSSIDTSQPAPAEVLSAKPDRPIDMKRYVGEAVYMSKRMNDD